MTTFVLSHGAYHGAWCWYRVATELDSRGHTVETLDLPAHGADTTPVDAVSLDDYLETVCEVIDGADAESVVLVGHSMSGIVISGVAERRPDAIDRLVYLTAYLPTDGDSMLDKRAPDAAVSEAFEVDEARGVGWVREDALDEVFYADCPPAERRLAHALVRPEPMDPISTGVTLTEERYGRVPRAYVECTQDASIPIDHQRAMREVVPVERVATLDASHSPFLSMPAATADALEAVSE